MRFLKYLKKLLREFGEFAWQNKAWWIVPIVLVLLLLTLRIVLLLALALVLALGL